MLGTKKYSTLPENADKVLFAEDFVNYILRKLQLPPLSTGIADHRDSVFNAFSPEVKQAAEIAYDADEVEILREFKDILEENENTIDHNAFLKYFTPMKSINVHPGKEGSRNFIFICVQLSYMAGKFYKHRCVEAPGLAVDYIASVIEDIDMVKEKGWDALNAVFEEWSDGFTTDPESQHECDRDSAIGSNSEDSRSPDPVMDGGQGQDEHSEELTDDKTCTAAISSSSKEPVSSIYESEHVEKIYDAKAGSNSGNKSDSVSPGSSKEKNSSIHSFKGTSIEDDISKQMMQLKRPSCSNSKDSDSDSKRCKTYIKTAD